MQILQTTKLSRTDKAVKLLLPLTFPEYTGRKFHLEVHAKPGMDLSSYWSEGSRDYFEIVKLDALAALSVPDNGTFYTRSTNAAMDRAEEMVPAPNYAVVEHSYFCGKDAGIRIHIHEANAVKMLPEGARS